MNKFPGPSPLMSMHPPRFDVPWCCDAKLCSKEPGYGCVYTACDVQGISGFVVSWTCCALRSWAAEFDAAFDREICAGDRVPYLGYPHLCESDRVKMVHIMC